MSGELPSVSIIIPTRPGQAEIEAVRTARALNYPREKLEILVARGKQPSVQRNTALRAAQGELIYFLDDDSMTAPDNLQRAQAHFADPAVKMLGGPNLCPSDAPTIEQVFAVVLSSWLAFGPSRARYDRVGSIRSTSEKELILCNLMARRNDVVTLGGFDESLYPNEENALMDELQRGGGKLIYDPSFSVDRRPRASLSGFCRMLMTYGRGRAEQFRLHPTLGSALNFVPPLFCIYLLALPVLGHFFEILSLIPLAAYALCVMGQTLVSALNKGVGRSLAAAPLVVACHVFYGIGFWRGLVTKIGSNAQKTAPEIVLERITL